MKQGGRMSCRFCCRRNIQQSRGKRNEPAKPGSHTARPLQGRCKHPCKESSRQKALPDKVDAPLSGRDHDSRVVSKGARAVSWKWDSCLKIKTRNNREGAGIWNENSLVTPKPQTGRETENTSSLPILGHEVAQHHLKMKRS